MSAFTSDTEIDSETEYDKLNECLNKISNEISNEFYKINIYLDKLHKIVNKNYNEKFMNNNFDEQEFIEEKFDELFYNYNKIKTLFKKGREMRICKEDKEKRLIRNLQLKIYYGIKN